MKCFKEGCTGKLRVVVTAPEKFSKDEYLAGNKMFMTCRRYKCPECGTVHFTQEYVTSMRTKNEGLVYSNQHHKFHKKYREFYELNNSTKAKKVKA